MFGYCYHSYDCGCKGREKTNAESGYQDVNMDKCRFYTNQSDLIINKIQSFDFSGNMDDFKRYMSLSRATFQGKIKNRSYLFGVFSKKNYFCKNIQKIQK